MEYKDYYQTLGVSRDATQDEIKKAFRKLARKYHPDVSKEKNAEARMKDVNEAYAVLSDPEKRVAYDQLGQDNRAGQEFRPPPDWDTGFEFSGRGPFDSRSRQRTREGPRSSRDPPIGPAAARAHHGRLLRIQIRSSLEEMINQH